MLWHLPKMRPSIWMLGLRLSDMAVLHGKLSSQAFYEKHPSLFHSMRNISLHFVGVMCTLHTIVSQSERNVLRVRRKLLLELTLAYFIAFE